MEIEKVRNKDALLDERETAAILGVQPRTLSVWRTTGRYQLPFVKVGRNVRYRLSHVQDWVEKQTQSSGATA